MKGRQVICFHDIPFKGYLTSNSKLIIFQSNCILSPVSLNSLVLNSKL